MNRVYFTVLTQNDLAAIAAIEKSAQKFPWSKQQLQDSLTAGHFCVAIKADVVIGYAILSTVLDEAEILNICIRPDYQHQGYGAKLFNYLLRYAQNRQINKIFLEVAASNLPAIAFYEKQGFKKISIRKNYYHREADNLAEDALIYQYVLLQSSIATP